MNRPTASVEKTWVAGCAQRPAGPPTKFEFGLDLILDGLDRLRVRHP